MRVKIPEAELHRDKLPQSSTLEGGAVSDVFHGRPIRRSDDWWLVASIARSDSADGLE